MMKNYIEFSGKRIEFTVERKKRKTVGISVTPEKGVLVSAPRWVDRGQLEDIVEKKGGWILKRLEALKDIKANSKCYRAGERYFFLGREHLLAVADDQDVKKPAVEYEEDRIWVLLPQTDPEGKADLVRDSLTAWYREEAIRIVTGRVEYFSRILGVKPAKLIFKSQKTLWGSCTRNNTINLNWRIIIAPLEIVDYLVVHELAHIREKNHSKAYWSLVESVLQDYRQRRKWLKDKGHLLQI